MQKIYLKSSAMIFTLWNYKATYALPRANYLCEKFSKECQTLILSMHRCTTMDDGAMSLIVRLHEEYKRTGKKLLITDYSHLDLLTSMAQKHTCYLRFEELDEALFYAENSLLESNWLFAENQNQFVSLTNSCSMALRSRR